jgi:hypothetical protein
MTMDELFLAYETAAERQKRLMKVVAAALGAPYDEGSPSSESSGYPPGTFVDDKGNVVQLFGYRKVDKIE